MTSKIAITDLPTNLIAFIYQYLNGKDMVAASHTNKKMLKALNQDFIYIELSKRDHLFLPSEGDRFGTWKEYFQYLKNYEKNISSGKPNIGYKMRPYRGHKFPIEAVEVFNHKTSMETTIVSGDSSGEVLTWNLGEDEDGDKLFEKDFIFKADSKIIGIKNINEDSNMIVWTKENTFYYYNVNMYNNKEKNSERFQLIKEFKIEDNDNPIKQLYYEKDSSKIFMSPDLSKAYILMNVYSYNLKTFTLEKYTFEYNFNQKKLVSNNNQNNNQAIINNNINNIFFAPFVNNNVFYNNHNEKRIKKSNSFVVTEDKLIVYINYDPVNKKLISSYNNSTSLPNIFVFDKEIRLFSYYHIDYDVILNILPIDNSKVVLIGSKKSQFNNQNEIILKIFSIKDFTLLSEKVLNKNETYNTYNFDVVYYKYPEIYYLINERNLRKIENIEVKLKIRKINDLNQIENITCIEADMFRIVLASDELYMGIFDLKTGKKWFNLLGGSKIQKTKSFVSHPNYNGFHFIKITRNSIISLIGNLIREYRFTFKYGKK